MATKKQSKLYIAVSRDRVVGSGDTIDSAKMNLQDFDGGEAVMIVEVPGDLLAQAELPVYIAG